MPYFILCTSSCSPSGVTHHISSNFKVTGKICRDLFKFLQYSYNPGYSHPQLLII